MRDRAGMLCPSCRTRCDDEGACICTPTPRLPITPRELGDAMRGEFSPSASSVKGPVR